MVFGWRTPHRLLTGEVKLALRTFAYSFFPVLQLFCSIHIFSTYVGYFRSTAGPSMLPTMNRKGDTIWISTRYRRGRGIEVGDLVSFKHPMNPGETACKRVLGMPGDYVMRDSVCSGSDRMIQIPDGHCWVAGDNAWASKDSRDYGPIPLALINGKATRRVWPLDQAGQFENNMRAVTQDKGFMKNG